MTGAKLLGMHESVTSPTVKDLSVSGVRVLLTVMPASCSGAMRTMLKRVTSGQIRRFVSASRTGAKRAMLEG